MKMFFYFWIIFGLLILVYLGFSFSKVQTQQSQLNVASTAESPVVVISGESKNKNQVEGINSELAIEGAGRDNPKLWTEKLSECMGADFFAQSTFENINQITDLYDKIHSTFGEPKEDSLILEETVLKWTGGESRMLRWEPNKDNHTTGDLFWYKKDLEGNPEPLDLPDHLDSPVSVEDYDRLVHTGQMVSQSQSRFLKYDTGLNVGLMTNNSLVSGISMDFNQKEIHCEEKIDKSVDCECLSSANSITE
jgi:hypothetical protein